MPNSSKSDYQHPLLEQFTCLGDACEDTCCKSWSMQLDQQHLDLYKKEQPQLLEAVDEDASGPIMRRDPKSDFCVKYEQGWCGVHKEFGTKFLGDACHFYPRVTRGLGESRVMTATMSCPEVARIALLQDTGKDGYAQTAFERVPNTLKGYLPDSLSAEQAMATHTAFLTALADESVTPEQSMLAIVSVARSLENLDVASWPDAVPFYLKTAESRLLPAEVDASDPYRLLHALVGLISAAPPVIRPRLDETVATMEQALEVELDRQALTIALKDESAPAYPTLKAKWSAHGSEACAPILRRWIATQLSTMLFPFAGLGATPYERAMLVAVRFATVRLALMCHMQENSPPDEETMIRVIQSLARFMDHLADAKLSLDIYKEVGWTREERLRGLLEG